MTEPVSVRGSGHSPEGEDPPEPDQPEQPGVDLRCSPVFTKGLMIGSDLALSVFREGGENYLAHATDLVSRASLALQNKRTLTYEISLASLLGYLRATDTLLACLRAENALGRDKDGHARLKIGKHLYTMRIE